MMAGCCCLESVFLRLGTLMGQRTATWKMRRPGRRSLPLWLSLCGGQQERQRRKTSRITWHRAINLVPLNFLCALKVEKADQRPFVIPTPPLAGRQLLSLAPFQMIIPFPCMVKELSEVPHCPFIRHF